MTELARDIPTLTWWMLLIFPIIGAASITQAWKLDGKYRRGRKPRNYECVLMSSAVCGLITFITQWTVAGASLAASGGMAILLGLAAPFIWWVVKTCGPEQLTRIMNGQRDVWSDEERKKRRKVVDTLYGDEDTLREQLRRRLRDDD